MFFLDLLFWCFLRSVTHGKSSPWKSQHHFLENIFEYHFFQSQKTWPFRKSSLFLPSAFFQHATLVLRSVPVFGVPCLCTTRPRRGSSSLIQGINESNPPAKDVYTWIPWDENGPDGWGPLVTDSGSSPKKNLGDLYFSWGRSGKIFSDLPRYIFWDAKPPTVIFVTGQLFQGLLPREPKIATTHPAGDDFWWIFFE